MKLLIVEARFYEDIADELVKGAVQAIENAGAEYDRLSVPGALEIPAAIRFAADGNDGYDGFIALGCVIRGETTHYDYVCGESARGLMELTIKDRLAIGNGILTVEDRDQAWARCSVDDKNKGGAVAEAAIRMIELKKQYGVS
ncbi:6,7-dimethyl-8-ribityllumazine synthase [Pseudemcibacter aquimaris]|uniref:6,7-dimethyl-8-ribityllumazine synthase n=1 Tax=Pseudemcibacter aquimaris TaxID=2857064 RepID=UPI0020121D2F|nr:6,7-dimethyl-8-ribityllumazine synthase [Pseudemcibacter aquimaris]MCC3860606.1 6,7-dimethyl-8-ribityllumazine synthase [Pseudemcibacter aquimaris]WDU59427.1 6,7-dimethyl-8-ribityllumazine synthase [Pseudemcibacter aquimaris]